MKTFRIYLAESAQLDDLRKVIKSNFGDVIKRQTNNGYYIEAKCQVDDNGKYEVTDKEERSLKSFVIDYNRSHKNNIDWDMPDSKIKQVYIHFTK